jgi:hypothetical protein
VECLDTAPRGTERRHFRGKSAAKAVRYMKSLKITPEEIVDDMCAHWHFSDVSKRVQTYYLFGPWIAWKIGDMAERILNYPISFKDTTLGIYKDPVQGAALIKYGDEDAPMDEGDLQEVCNRIEYHFRNQLAPPFYDRDVNIQEVETILCKYKAHCFGHYPLGKDTREVTHGLSGWGDLAENLVQFMPHGK